MTFAKTTAALLLAALVALPTAAQAQPFPNKPIRLVVGFGAGGGTDVCARTLGQHVGDALGQTVIVENRPGGGSTLSIAHLVRQDPDGYTLATFSTGALLNQLIPGRVSYDVTRDLAPVAMVAQYQMGLLVRADSPFQTMADLVAAARKDPKAVSYSTAGAGTPQHLTMERVAGLAGLQWTHVPYKSGPEAIMAVMRGDVQALSQTAEWVPYVRDGRLRLLATYGPSRMTGFESAPTLKEAGFDLIAPSILGVVGPRGVPADIVARLEAAFTKALETPEFASCSDRFGLKPDHKSAASFGAHLAQTLAEWRPVVQKLGLD